MRQPNLEETSTSGSEFLLPNLWSGGLFFSTEAFTSTFCRRVLLSTAKCIIPSLQSSSSGLGTISRSTLHDCGTRSSPSNKMRHLVMRPWSYLCSKMTWNMEANIFFHSVNQFNLAISDGEEVKNTLLCN